MEYEMIYLIRTNKMKKNKRTYIYFIGAFALLMLVSLYKQFSIHYLPNDIFRPYIVYAVYFFLMGCWIYSVVHRIEQRSMRLNLTLAAIVMLFWLVIRFLQEVYFYKHIQIMRTSGYFTVFPLIVTTLFGVYAAFGLGMGVDYSVPKKWYLLVIPDFFLVGLELTNEHHHIVFKVHKGEGVNLSFHPNIGFIIVLAAATVLIVSRIMIIYMRSKKTPGNNLSRPLPLIIGIMIPVVILPYMLNSFLPQAELIELTIKLYILEILSWESCIILGLVPVNTQYGMVFEQSTVGMRITDKEGLTLIKSLHARELTDNELKLLMEKTSFTADKGYEMHLHSLSDGYLIYQKDVSGINNAIIELDRQSAELTQENTLLSKELHSRSEKARVAAQNQIYDRLSGETGTQLSLIKNMMAKADTVHRKEMLKMLCVLGTYVKRRCNLRLIEQETGSIAMDELRLSLEDTVACLNLVGIKAKLIWEPDREYSSEYSLRLYDLIEKEIEAQKYAPKELIITAGETASVSITSKDGTRSVSPQPDKKEAASV